MLRIFRCKWVQGIDYIYHHCCNTRWLWVSDEAHNCLYTEKQKAWESDKEFQVSILAHKFDLQPYCPSLFLLFSLCSSPNSGIYQGLALNKHYIIIIIIVIKVVPSWQQGCFQISNGRVLNTNFMFIVTFIAQFHSTVTEFLTTWLFSWGWWIYDMLTFSQEGT